MRCYAIILMTKYYLDFFPFPPLSSPDSLLELSPDDDEEEEELPESELLPLEALLLEELFDLDASDELLKENPNSELVLIKNKNFVGVRLTYHCQNVNHHPFSCHLCL